MPVDRGGGRESKKGSLRRSTKNPGAPAARQKMAPTAEKCVIFKPRAMLKRTNFAVTPAIDFGAALLSRQFDTDREDVMRRSGDDGCCAAVVMWSSAIDKQSELVQFASHTYEGICYCVVGVHPDNIDRTNKRQQEQWVESIEEHLTHSVCVGILSGFNTKRDAATFFAQETLLKSHGSLAAKTKLPLFVHCMSSDALLKVFEILKEDDWFRHGVPLVVHDIVTACSGDVTILQSVLTMIPRGFPVMFSVSATGFGASDVPPPEVVVQAVPLENMILCSNSPWGTPQNHPEADLRELKNEPSNMPHIAQYLSDALKIPKEKLFERTRDNALSIMSLGKVPGGQPEAHDGANEESSSEGEAESPREKATTTDIPPAPSAVAPPPPAAPVIPMVYQCHKCRAMLFTTRDLMSKEEILALEDPQGEQQQYQYTNKKEKGGKKSKQNEEIQDVIVVRHSLDLKQLSLLHGVVECCNCGSKLGRFTNGNLCRIMTARVDEAPESTLQMSLQELTLHAKKEQDGLQDDEDSDSSSDGGRKKKKGKKKIVKQNNRSNMGDFRNKSFA